MTYSVTIQRPANNLLPVKSTPPCTTNPTTPVYITLTLYVSDALQLGRQQQCVGERLGDAL